MQNEKLIKNRLKRLEEIMLIQTEIPALVPLSFIPNAF